ncbi:Nfu1 iron-sulfur cluster protein [Thalictrum thalictroides]|uniref:Nfu1 iron-sulfur cluster protein n=1 Tax=Thalictrum thalictroides TaxID=46969 RepID=A0A7J6X2Z0_THATH|nr:Nfu1 iron-sulfur cluster protein [Thalictrum thalictroides]
MMSGIPANGSHSYATSTKNPIKTTIEELRSSVKKKGDVVPVCVALGMIMLSLSFGAHTGLHHLRYSPTVQVSKKKREELPEVEEPDYVVDEAIKFINKSFFRKVAHIQDHFQQDEVIPNPIKGDVYTRPVRVETLKPIQVDLGSQ